MVRHKSYSTHWQFTRFFHKSNITCIISGTRTGILPEHTSLPGFFCGVRIAQSLLLCVVSSRSLLFWLSCLGTLGYPVYALLLSCLCPLAILFMPFGYPVYALWLSCLCPFAFCLGTLVLLLPKTLNYSDFQFFESFDFERTG